MKILSMFLCVVFVTACTDKLPVDASQSADDEPELFKAGRYAAGPLTLGELQINIPDEVDKTLDDSRRTCFFDAVTRLANEAGDPADIEPDTLPYWRGEVDKNEWGQLSKYMQRVLLAQAIISWAMIEC